MINSDNKTKWLKEISLFVIMILFSLLLMFVLIRYQDFLKSYLINYEVAGYFLVFLVCLLSSATIFVPAPGLAFMLAAAAIWNPAIVAIAAGTGDALGEMTSYWVGYVGEKIIIDEHMPAYEKSVLWMRKYGMIAIFGVALVPIILFDLVAIAAGALKIPAWKFLVSCWAGKVPRAFVFAFLGHQIPLLIHPFS